MREMGRSYVTEEWARIYEAGALAALDYIAGEWPHLAESHDEFPGVTMATAEHIGRVIDVMLGREGVATSGETKSPPR